MTSLRRTLPKAVAEPAPDPLIDAALACLADYGIGKTSLTDVARRARVSRTTAYRVFGSKQGMLDAVARKEVEHYLEGLERAIEGTPSGPEAMRAGILYTLDYLDGHALLQRIYRDEPETMLDLIVERDGSPEILDRLTEAIAAILSRWVEPEQLSHPIEQSAEWVVRATYSFLLMPSTRITGPDQISSLLLRGIALPPDGPENSPTR